MSKGRISGSKNTPLPPPLALPGLEPRLTTREAAAFLRRSPTTLEIWRCSGYGPRYLKAPGRGGRVTYRFSDLEAFEQRHEHTSEAHHG